MEILLKILVRDWLVTVCTLRKLICMNINGQYRALIPGYNLCNAVGNPAYGEAQLARTQS